MDDYRLRPEDIGANDYSDYDPEWCDGHVCPRDCARCRWGADNREEE